LPEKHCPEKLENATTVGHLGFRVRDYEENFGREITDYRDYIVFEKLRLTVDKLRSQFSPVIIYTLPHAQFSLLRLLHCASLLRIILRVISARALKYGGFFFAAGPRQRGKSSFSRRRAWWPIIFSVLLN